MAVIDNQQEQGSHIYRTVQCRAGVVVRSSVMVPAWSDRRMGLIDGMFDLKNNRFNAGVSDWE